MEFYCSQNYVIIYVTLIKELANGSEEMKQDHLPRVLTCLRKLLVTVVDFFLTSKTALKGFIDKR